MPLLRRALRFLGVSSGLTVQEGTQQPQPLSHESPSPATVNFDTAMQLSAVWASARLLTETISALPLEFHSIDNAGNKRPDTASDLSKVFRGKVNRYQTRQEFLETFVLNLVMHGNAYAIKQEAGGRLVGLLPLMTAQVETNLLPDGSLVHIHYHDNGVTAYADDSIWHAKLFGNGIIGMSPLAYARNTFGIALAGESRVAHIYRNGAKPAGVLMIDKVLNKEQRDHIRTEFNDLREGNGERLMVLEAGMKYQQVSMSPQDIQLLESRRFQIEDIARFFGVPSVLINDTSGSTTWGSGIHQIVQGFYKLNLRPYLERLESSMVHKLGSPGARERMIAEFNFDALLRADMQTRFEAWQKAIQSGLFKPNEARSRENLPPEDGGDRLYVNGTMVPLTQAGRIERPQGDR